MTPRGTTYITVGSHGFYYRETLPRNGDVPRAGSEPPLGVPDAAEGAIVSAGSLDLIDSSSERLVQQLNERARMANPAWLFFLGVVIALAGLMMLPPVPSLPDLPAATLASESSPNRVDEYAPLTARFGEPDSIRFAEVDPFAPVTVGTVRYDAEHLRIVFVPNGCVDTYNQVTGIRSDRSLSGVSARHALRNVVRCEPVSDAGWATVGYVDSFENTPVSARVATARLEALTEKRQSPPTIEFEANPVSEGKVSRRGPAPRQPLKMESSDQSRSTLNQQKQGIHSAETRTLYSRIGLTLAAVGLLAGGIVTQRRNTEKRKSRLFYELNEAEQKKHDAVRESLGFLASCRAIWRIEAKAATSDWKRNAGASSLVQRINIRVGAINPPRVETNVSVPCIEMRQSQLYFLPDTVLYRDANGYGAIGYNDLKVTQWLTRFIEDGTVPADATVVDYTWRFVNKNGGPDRRFNNNRQLPVLQLGALTLVSSRGLNIQLNTSNPQGSVAFAAHWQTVFHIEHQREEPAHSKPPLSVRPSSDANAIARKILGVSATASDDEISQAYRRLAQMYHPDKVAGLGPEFQVLADKRMKEINAAYEVLKQEIR
jgi:hypothetical protein